MRSRLFEGGSFLWFAAYASPWLVRTSGVALQTRARGAKREQRVDAATGVDAGASAAADRLLRTGQDASLGTMVAKYPWYHTAEQIRDEVRRLEFSCGGAITRDTREDSNVTIEIVRVRDPRHNPRNKVMIVFGEHSREVIGPETGLRFLQRLCGQSPDMSDGFAFPFALHPVLQHSEFKLVLNANPRSRVKVEQGEFCLRTNPSGVDTNRNWNVSWSPQALDTIAYPGPRAFSEPETRILRDLILAYNPTVFLTVHSGTRGLYMPWAFDDKHAAHRNRHAMLQVLREIDAEHCECPYGPAGLEIGYPCPGTSLDYAYMMNVPYSFAFEIYTDQKTTEKLHGAWIRKMREEGASLLQSGSHLGHSHFASLFEEHTSDFVRSAQQRAESPASTTNAPPPDVMVNHSIPHRVFFKTYAEVDECFPNFNPHTKALYDDTLRHWSTAYLEVAQLTASKLTDTANVELL